jgi:hypothetical protein
LWRPAPRRRALRRPPAGDAAALGSQQRRRGRLDALLLAGPTSSADGAVIAGSTPLADRDRFGQWNAARRLVDRGARTDLWRLRHSACSTASSPWSTGDPPRRRKQITEAFWGACHGGHEHAEYLLEPARNSTGPDGTA